ncbi:molybdopterin adenylyltransferase [Ochrovirga pacifica]|uniref:molybdopterin adenylyltransferase n=1 Tax=Ochrovirga pacifica TaxID=1042376 RepID=UPI000255776D|nr:molybdopterin adenylyltransferase [Ochrovirga pacifica]
MNKDSINIGILTISDRASQGIYEDLSGKAIATVLSTYIQSTWQKRYVIIPDEQDMIETTLKKLADQDNCCLIFTTGGTGPAKRDVTVEATENVCEKLLPGFGELMRKVSLEFVPTAILSRQTAGIYKETLIVNLPGKPSAIKDCMQSVFPAIPYCVDLIDGPYLEVNTNNTTAFRPKNK